VGAAPVLLLSHEATTLACGGQLPDTIKSLQTLAIDQQQHPEIFMRTHKRNSPTTPNTWLQLVARMQEGPNSVQELVAINTN